MFLYFICSESLCKHDKPCMTWPYIVLYYAHIICPQLRICLISKGNMVLFVKCLSYTNDWVSIFYLATFAQPCTIIYNTAPSLCFQPVLFGKCFLSATSLPVTQNSYIFKLFISPGYISTYWNTSCETLQSYEMVFGGSFNEWLRSFQYGKIIATATNA